MLTTSDKYTLELEDRDGYLYARLASDENNGAILVSAFQEITARCRSIGVSKVFVEHATPTALSTGEAYDAAVGVVELDLAGVKIAYLDRDPTHLETNQFGELVAVNRGLVGKAFADEGEAMNWLLA